MFKKKISNKKYYSLLIKLWFQELTKNLFSKYTIFVRNWICICRVHIKNKYKNLWNVLERDVQNNLNGVIAQIIFKTCNLVYNLCVQKIVNIKKQSIFLILSKQIHLLTQLKNIIYFCIYFITIICFFCILFSNNVLYYKFFYKLFFIFMLGFFLFSTFIHLNKQYQYNKYTSQIQRFWKRTYMVFWFIELNLFSLFIYLMMVHFSESLYFLDWKSIQSLWFDSVLSVLFFIFFLNILVFVGYLMFFFLNQIWW